MRKYLLLIFCAIFLSCISSSHRFAVLTETYQVPLESKWNLYVFDVQSENSLGRAFIADYNIWSAKHIFNAQDPGVCDDILSLGKTEVKGLDICEIKHHINDILFFRSKEGIKYLLIAYEEDIFFGVIPLSPIKCGESGSPVICLKDGGVVGLVSHMMEDQNGVCIGGQIARIYRKKAE